MSVNIVRVSKTSSQVLNQRPLRALSQDFEVCLRSFLAEMALGHVHKV
jgi:hypothetical protein